MTHPTRRFGAFHTYNQTSQPRSFAPDEVDPLIIENISPEWSPNKSDKTVESYAQALSDDETVETYGKWCKGRGKKSTASVEKPVEKRRFKVTSF